MMETRTLLLLNLVLLSSFAAGLLVVCFASPALRHLRWLVPAYSAGSAATLLYLFRAHFAGFPTQDATDLLILTAYVLLHRALCDLTGGTRRLVWFGLWLLLVEVLGLGWLAARYHTPQHSLALLSALLATQLCVSAITVLRNVRPGLATPTALMAAILFLYALFNLLRMVVALVATPMQRNLAPFLYLESGDLVLAIVTSVGILFSFIWMNTETLRLELERMARTDALTGLLNRRAFFNEFERESARSLRAGTPLCMLQMDLDHFKFVNDLHGHQAGDTVLCALARILQRCLRRGDLVGRLGGEEFAALLPETTEDQAMALAERLRGMIEEQPVSLNDAELHVTASFGIACWAGTGESLEQLMHHADSAMYVAKQAGRNCVRSREKDQ